METMFELQLKNLIFQLDSKFELNSSNNQIQLSQAQVLDFFEKIEFKYCVQAFLVRIDYEHFITGPVI